MAHALVRATYPFSIENRRSEVAIVKGPSVSISEAPSDGFQTQHFNSKSSYRITNLVPYFIIQSLCLPLIKVFRKSKVESRGHTLH